MLNGIFAAPLVPLRPDGSLNLELVERQAHLLLDRGAEGFYLCGNTGEGYHLTVEERMSLVRRWREVIGDRVPLYVHVYSPCLKDACTLAADAQKQGAAAISSMGPTAASSNLEAIVNWSAAIAASAPQLPFLHYHFAAFNIRMSDYCPLAIKRIPNFGGLKYTHADLMDLGQARLILGDEHKVYYGYDEMLLYGLISGADGAIGGSYNLTSPLALEIRQAWRDDNLAEAQKIQRKLQDVVAVLHRHGSGLGVLKASVRALGLNCGPARPPATSLSEQTIAAMVAELEQVWPEINAPVKAHAMR
ncbi:MAG: dihydrodipicolinate synthase family protein [Phycisphaeraceae bacterium]|nr:dihydrodipicolinate synthase family protein [Phycisphaeraceae bacterium]